MANRAAAEACVWFQRAIEQRPEVAATRLHLGEALQARGDMASAAEAYQAALALDAGLLPAHLNLGQAYYALRRLEDAATAFAAALQLQPELAQLHFNLGNIQRELGRIEAAIGSYQQAIRFDPADADAHANLGALYQERGENERALQHTRAALRLQPALAPAHINLGKLLFDAGQIDAAEQAYREGLRLNPDDSVGWTGLTDVLQKKSDWQGAADAVRAVLRLHPADASAWATLADILPKKGDLAGAAEAVAALLHLHPDDCGGWIRRSDILEKQLDYEAAAAAARTAINLPGCRRDALYRLISIANAQNQFADYDAHVEQLLTLYPKELTAYQSRLFHSNYRSDMSLDQVRALAARHAEVAREYARPYSHWCCEPVPERTLRIGLVSGDFQRHPVGYLLLKPLHDLDRTRLEIYCYYNDEHQDDLTARFQYNATQWRDVAKLDDGQLAAQIYDDAIDILIDLAGVTAKNRLSVFAWKPAPVQVTWLGYYATTGLREFDWILADRWVLPAEEEAQFVENPWRLPDSYYCYTPPADSLPVVPLPALERGFVTLGCFNQYNKLNDAVFRCWAGIMLKLPDSRLFLKNKALGNERIRAEVEAQFAALGIERTRLRLEGVSSHGQYMRAYNEVDMALDPFPFPGGITSIEGLWMGVPVLTLKGQRFIGHQGETILHSAGLADWIADDEAEYVARALQRLADLPALARLRAELREQVRASSLCNAERFARNLEAAWRGMWRVWCERGSLPETA